MALLPAAVGSEQKGDCILRLSHTPRQFWIGNQSDLLIVPGGELVFVLPLRDTNGNHWIEFFSIWFVPSCCVLAPTKELNEARFANRHVAAGRQIVACRGGQEHECEDGLFGM